MRKKILICFISLCFVIFIFYLITLNPIDSSALEVSIERLIENPSEYHGKKVRVVGIGHLELEVNGIYPNIDVHEAYHSETDVIFTDTSTQIRYENPESWKHVLNKNGIWIDLGSRATPYIMARSYNGRYVLIEGTFDMNNTGNRGLWSGAIVNISRYVLWKE